MCGCGKERVPAAQKWQYLTVECENYVHSEEDAASKKGDHTMENTYREWPGSFSINVRLGTEKWANLDELGSSGWELVSAVPQTETIYPRYPSDKQSQANIRTGTIIFIFKRPLK